MARRRMIEVTIAKDKILNSLSEFAQLLYLKMLPHTDDFGRMEGDPETVKVMVDGFSKREVKDYEMAMAEISSKGLWLWYETDNGKKIVQYNPSSFERINAFLIKKRGNPEYPEFKEDVYKVISIDINLYPPINNNKYKVESKKQKELDPRFEKFWDMYGKKVGKPKTMALWDKLKDSEIEAIFQHLPLYTQKQKTYRKDPERYISKRVWEDEVVLTQDKSNKYSLGEYVTYDEILKFTQNESAEFRKSIFDKYEAIGNGKFKLKK